MPRLMQALVLAGVIFLSALIPGVAMGQECQTLADVQVKMAENGHREIVTVRNSAATAVINAMRFNAPLPEFDEVLFLDLGLPNAIGMILLNDDCTVRAMPVLASPDQIISLVQRVAPEA